MYYRISSILVTFICLFSCVLTSSAQDTSNTDETEKPVILYSGTPKKYEIADIKVVGGNTIVHFFIYYIYDLLFTICVCPVSGFVRWFFRTCVHASDSRGWLCEVPLHGSQASRCRRNKVPSKHIARAGSCSSGFLRPYVSINPDRTNTNCK